MIDQLTIDRIMDTANIVEVVSEFVTLRKRGVNYTGLCPFHNEKTPSFSVSPAKQLCKCFSCGEGGNVVHFLMKHEQISYVEALRWLARKYGIEIQERELSDQEKQAASLRESLFIVNEYARDYFTQTLFEHPEGQTIGLAYFRQRGFREDIIRKFQLGFCTKNWDDFAKSAISKGYKREFLLKTGLCYEKENKDLIDRFHGRVIFPVHTLSGKIVAFGGRILSQDKKTAKYVNSPESEIYSKSRELYGLYLAKAAIVRQDRCFLVEGYTDVISMHQAGVENVVASSGTSLTTGQIRLIHRFTNNVTVLYDGDKAGIKASIRGIDMLLEEGISIKVVLLPEGEDPDSFAKSHNATDFQEYIKEHETDFIRFKTDLLLDEAGKDPIKRAILIKEIVKSISFIPERIVRDVYINECSRLLEVEAQLLSNETLRVIDERRNSVPSANEETYNKTTQNTLNSVTSTNPNTTELNSPPLENTVNQDADEYSAIEGGEAGILATHPGTFGKRNLLYEQEILIMKLLIRNGEKVMCIIEDEEGEQHELRDADFINSSLLEDGFELQDPIHRALLNEILVHIDEPNFECERFLTQHPNQKISQRASNLATEQWILSRMYSKNKPLANEESKERLDEQAVRLITDFKEMAISYEMTAFLENLQDPIYQGDSKKMDAALKRFKAVQEIRCELEKRTGSRVIPRWKLS